MDNSKNKNRGKGLPKWLHDMIMEAGDEAMKKVKEEIYAQRSSKDQKAKTKKK